MTISLNIAGLGNRGIFAIRAASSGSFVQAIASTNITATTGILSGTTGANGTVTVSTHSDNKLYIENRTGSTVLFAVGLFGRFLPASMAYTQTP
jgi:hypothetical protein